MEQLKKQQILDLFEEKAECGFNYGCIDETQFDNLADEIVKLFSMHFVSNNEERVAVNCYNCNRYGKAQREAMYCSKCNDFSEFKAIN